MLQADTVGRRLPAVYVAGVTSTPGPLTEALARFSARTALLPRTNPVAETAADSRATSPLTNGWKPTPVPPRPFTGMSATSVTENGVVHLTGTYHNSRPLATHTLTINWGESAPQMVSVSGGTSTVSPKRPKFRTFSGVMVRTEGTGMG